eukprot:5188752-Pyramimonas_sp.AAC.1
MFVITGPVLAGAASCARLDPKRFNSAALRPERASRSAAACSVNADNKPLFSHFTAGEFVSPPDYSRTVSTARTTCPCSATPPPESSLLSPNVYGR